MILLSISMTRRWIEIDTVDDIDTGKIHIGNINDRYIDRFGNRFATRFNKRSRKIDIVPIALGIEEAKEARDRMHGYIPPEKEKSGGSEKSSDHPAPQKLPGWVYELDIEPDRSVELNSIMGELQNETQRFQERFKGIIQNLKNSEAVGKSESGQDFILEIQSIFDRDILKYISETENLIVEFNRFAKTPAHYLANLDRKQKSFVERLNEEEQMEYFKAYYIGLSYLEALGGGFHLIDKVKKETAGLDSSQVAHDKKMFFENAMDSTGLLQGQIIDQASRITGWLEKAKVI